MTATPPDSFARRSWSFSLVVVGGGGGNGGADLWARSWMASGVAVAVDDGGVVLGDHDLTGSDPDRSILASCSSMFSSAGNDGAAGQDGDILQHFLAAVAEAGSLHADAR